MIRMEEYAFTKADKALPATLVKTIRGTFDSTWKDQLLIWNGVSITYDAIGNMVKKGNTTYTWTQGRKLSAVNNGKKIQYFYDHTGLIDENGTSVVQYQYDSWGKQIKDGKSLKELNLIDVASSAISCAVAVTGPGAAYGAKLGRLKIKRKLNKLNYAGKGINYRVHRRIIGWGFYSDGKTGESYTYPIYSS